VTHLEFWRTLTCLVYKKKKKITESQLFVRAVLMIYVISAPGRNDYLVRGRN
jgi:hypothetical protein